MGTLTEVTDADYPSETVPGIVYLDGTYYVMTPVGRICGSEINDPTSWDALNFIQCQAEPDSGVAIARLANYVVGFSQYSTEFFYNAGNPTGSPLLPMSSGLVNIGCANGMSVQNTENTLIFIGQSRQLGRGVYAFNGLSPQKVSNPFIDRILMADDMSDIYAFIVKPAGHVFYVLRLGDVGRTLVYDFVTQDWHEWDFLEAGSAVTVTSLTQSLGIATATAADHGFSDGDVVTIAGAVQTGYNLTANVTVTSSSTFTYLVDSATVTPATTLTSITATGYTHTNFPGAFASEYNNASVIQTRSGGTVYLFTPDVYEDVGVPIDVIIRTSKMDGDSNKKKFFKSAAVIGDKVDSDAFLRYTDDDYQTWSYYRPIDLSLDRSKVSRLGSGRRRAFELRHNADTALRVEALELDVTEGVA